MDPIREIPKKFTKKFGNKVINRQYFRRRTGLKTLGLVKVLASSGIHITVISLHMNESNLESSDRKRDNISRF